VTLTGWKLGVALVGASLAGVGAGTFASGWNKTRGLTVETTADAGVSVTLDAGVKSSADCGAVVEHWTTIRVPGPVRYVVVDGGQVPQPTETVTVLVPDVRLEGSGRASVALQDDVRAQAGASATVTVPSPSGGLLWGVGLGVQHDVDFRPTVNGQLGYRWASGWSASLGGGMDPLATSHWSAAVVIGGSL
jgi:hypothetical protein